MNSFASFMGSAAGRVIRIVAGAALIAWGLMGIGGTNGYIVAGIGLVPIFTGLMNICLIAPFIGSPLSGAKARAFDS